MKLNIHVSRLALNDIAGTPGVAGEVSHVNTRNLVKFRVPVAAEVFKSKGIYDEKKLVGMTTWSGPRRFRGKLKQDGGTEVVEAKAGNCSSTLSVAQVQQKIYQMKDQSSNKTNTRWWEHKLLKRRLERVRPHFP